MNSPVLESEGVRLSGKTKEGSENLHSLSPRSLVPFYIYQGLRRGGRNLHFPGTRLVPRPTPRSGNFRRPVPNTLRGPHPYLSTALSLGPRVRTNICLVWNRRDLGPKGYRRTSGMRYNSRVRRPDKKREDGWRVREVPVDFLMRFGLRLGDRF